MNRHRNATATETSANIEQQHTRELLDAVHNCRPVRYEGRHRFVHSLLVQVYAGGTQTTLYLTGSAEEVAPDQVQIQEGI
ncbi:MAG: hypothetical protein ACRYF5_18710 [Janthinobacterium lividum]